MKKKTYLSCAEWKWVYDVPESSNNILVSCQMLSTNNPKKCGDGADFVTEVDGVEFYWNDEPEQIFVYLPKLDGSKPTAADKETGVYIQKNAD